MHREDATSEVNFNVVEDGSTPASLPSGVESAISDVHLCAVEDGNTSACLSSGVESATLDVILPDSSTTEGCDAFLNFLNVNLLL